MPQFRESRSGSRVHETGPAGATPEPTVEPGSTTEADQRYGGLPRLIIAYVVITAAMVAGIAPVVAVRRRRSG